MDARQQTRGGRHVFLAEERRGVVGVAERIQAAVSNKTVRVKGRAASDLILNELVECFLTGVGDPGQSNPADAAPVLLRRH